MKLVSKTALGLALALGSVAVATVPAVAQKKEKEAKQEPLKLSKEFRAAAGPIDAAYKKQDWPGTIAAVNAAQAAATTPDEKYALAQYQLNAATQMKDTAQQAVALDAMLATGKVPADQVGQFNFYSGRFALEKKNYPKALAAFTAAEQAGYKTPELMLSKTQVYAGQNNYQQAVANLQAAIDAEKAAGRTPPEDWYKFGLAQAYKGKLNAEVSRWASMHVNAYPTKENWRTALVLYRDMANPGDKPLLDLYRLMLASNALAGEKDYYEYAFLANRAGLPGEAKKVLDHMKASGTQSTNAGVAELRKEVDGRAAGDRSSLAGEEKTASSAASGGNAAGVANAYLGYGDYAKAASLYQTALSKGGIDADEVNTRLGIALALQGQKDAAKAAFSKVQTPARAPIAQYWTAWLEKPAA